MLDWIAYAYGVRSRTKSILGFRGLVNTSSLRKLFFESLSVFFVASVPCLPVVASLDSSYSFIRGTAGFSSWRSYGLMWSLRHSYVFVSSGLPFVDCATYLSRYLIYGEIYCTDFTCISYTFPLLLVTLLLCYPVTLEPCYPVTLLLHDLVTMLPCYPVTLLRCYLVTLLPCYPVTLLLCCTLLPCCSDFYLGNLLLCYLVPWLLCYPVALLPCHSVILLLYYLVSLLLCYLVTLLLCCSVTLLLCYLVTLLLCAFFTLSPCYPVA